MTQADADLRELAAKAVQQAGELGAAAAVSAHATREVEVQWRDGQVEKLLEATSRGLDVELYVDGRYAAVSTSDLRPDAVAAFLCDAVALTRTLQADPFRELPAADLCHAVECDLQVEDPRYGDQSAQQRQAACAAIEAAARAVPGSAAILSVTAQVQDSLHRSWRVTSNGSQAHRRSTAAWYGCEVSAQDPDGRRPEDWCSAGARYASDLPKPDTIGTDAATRTLERIGSRKGQSALQAVVIDPRAAGRLVSYLLGPMAAAALQQKRSFLDGKFGTAVGSRHLDFTDDPFVARGLGSRLHDGEGLAARVLPLFSDGVLRHGFVDTYYGKKLGWVPTTGRMSNLAWKLGDRDRDGLVAAAGDGLLVTGFLGGNSNGTTGDFSLGVQGFAIRGGQVAEPLAEMNLSGNHQELWPRLAGVGNDPYPYSPLRTPALLFDGVQVAGL
jgi:PmbA protein